MRKDSKRAVRFALVCLAVLVCTQGLVFAGGAQDTAAQAKGPVTLTAFFVDTNANWNNMQDDTGKYITEKTGVIIKAEFAVGDPAQKINLMAASGQYPDLIMPKGDTGVLVDSGALLDLEPLIDKYGPNIKKVMGDEIVRMRFSNSDPKIYSIPFDPVGRIEPDADAFFKLQLAALKEQGYPKVETLADYENVIAKWVKAHPVTADGKPTIGLSLLADDWRFVISTTNPAFWATGKADDGEWWIDPVTFQAKPHFFRPDEREYFRWLNHMNDIGLLDPESFTQKYDQYKAKIATGRVVGVIDAFWEIDDAKYSLRAGGHPELTYGRFGAVLKKGMKAAYYTPTGFLGGWGLCVTTACKQPDAAMKFLDYLASDEGQVVVQWGLEGKHYTYVNGKRQFTPEYDKMKADDLNTFKRTTGIGNYQMSVRYGDGVKDKTGNYYTTRYPEQLIAEYSEPEKEALKAYGVKLWGELLPQPGEFKTVPWAAAWSITVPKDNIVNEFWNVEQDITRKYIPMAILAKPADFDKTYDAFLAELTKSCAKYNDAMSGLVQDRMKLWGVMK